MTVYFFLFITINFWIGLVDFRLYHLTPDTSTVCVCVCVCVLFSGCGDPVASDSPPGCDAHHQLWEESGGFSQPRPVLTFHED